MTGNVKTLYKATDFFGLVINTDEYVNKKSKIKLKFCVWYVLIAIIIIACLVLSMLSLRLSYLASDSVRELRIEVNKLKAILNYTSINKISTFEQPDYNDYLDANNANWKKSIEQESDEVDKQALSITNHADVLGIVKFIENDGTTPNPELTLAKILLKNRVQNRIARSVQPVVEKKFSSLTNKHKIQPVAESLEISESVSQTPNVEQETIRKYLTIRSPINDQFKDPLITNKLTKTGLRIRDSVEEFSVEPEPMTPRIDTPLKRNKNRSRHNIEAIDERGGTARKKILPVVHFDGDASGYIVGKHTNYNGNGHLSHPSQVYSDWVKADWVKSLGMDEYFYLENGLVKIKETGLYLIYVQIYYLDDHDTNGYRVYKNEETLLQCTTMTHSTERIFKGNTCYTSRVEYFKENDVMSIRDLANSRYTIFESGKSFFGLVKLK